MVPHVLIDAQGRCPGEPGLVGGQVLKSRLDRPSQGPPGHREPARQAVDRGVLEAQLPDRPADRPGRQGPARRDQPGQLLAERPPRAARVRARPPALAPVDLNRHEAVRTLRTNRETTPEGFHDEVLSDHIAPDHKTNHQVSELPSHPDCEGGTSQVWVGLVLGIAGLALYGIPAIAVWIWAIIDASIKPRSYYEEYDA